MTRPAAVLAIIVVCLGALTGCGPRVSTAQLGVSVDDAGNPVLVLQDCEGVIEELEVYASGMKTTATRSPGVPDWELVNRSPAKAVTSIPLYTGGGDWKAAEKVPPLTGVARYSVQSWGGRHEWTGGHIAFTLSDLKSLKPGQVRHRASTPTGSTSLPATPRPPDGEYQVSPLESFVPPDCP